MVDIIKVDFGYRRTKMTNQEKQELKLLRDKATDILVGAGMEADIGADIFSRTNLDSLNDKDFLSVLEIIISTDKKIREII
jgi:hypothetical protein